MYLEPFCDRAVLDKLSAGFQAGEESSMDASRTTALCHTVSPPFITVQVRDYQLEGINRLLEWYARGVGGILADEM
jgi:SNF2 family DNA or RNA helicase